MSQVQALIEQAVQQAEDRARAVAAEALAEVSEQLVKAEARIKALEDRLSAPTAAPARRAPAQPKS